jgi:hypothetical protein
MTDSREAPARRLGRRLQAELNLFVQFHLGFDANVVYAFSDKGMQVSIEHPRVQAFSFRLDLQEMRGLVDDPDLFEEFLLTHLTDHRKS